MLSRPSGSAFVRALTNVLWSALLLIAASNASGRAEDAPQASSGEQAAQQARAAAAARGGPPQGWTKEFGAALIANPEFNGSSSYNLIPVPYFDFRYFDRQGLKHFANVPQGLGTYFYRDGNPTSGRTAAFVSIAPGFANRDPDSDDLDGLDTFGPSIEARLGIEYSIRAWSFNATVAQALATGHEGLYVDLSASYQQRFGSSSFFSIGPNLRIGNEQYMDAFHSVTVRESERTGLAPFEAGSGVEQLGFRGVLSVPVAGQWRLTSVLGLSFLHGDADDSSLSEETTQAFFLTALTRQF
ncbi:MAG: MipA/OmpV family protein [Pseudomonadota bacterium]